MVTRGLMLYDDDCGFCRRSAARVHRLGVAVDRAPIQGTDLAAYGIAEERALREMPFVRPDGSVVYGHEAWAAILATGPLPARLLGRLLVARPLRGVSARGYAWVAANRQRLPGGTAACELPTERD